MSTPAERLVKIDRELHQAQMLAFGLIDEVGLHHVDPKDQTDMQRMVAMLYHHIHEARKQIGDRPDVGIVEPWLPLRPSDLEPAELLVELRDLRARHTALEARYDATLRVRT